MVPLHSPSEYLFQLHATSSGEAKRLWRKHIKESWDYKCAYCGSEENITIDHIIPQSKGGNGTTKNVVCCCQNCNKDKGHIHWEDWYFSQSFFNVNRYEKIKEWMKPDPPSNLYRYRVRRNNAS